MDIIAATLLASLAAIVGSVVGLVALIRTTRVSNRDNFIVSMSSFNSVCQKRVETLEKELIVTKEIVRINNDTLNTTRDQVQSLLAQVVILTDENKRLQLQINILREGNKPQ